MSVNLQKGQKVDLTKGNAGLKRLIVGLGWDEAEKKVGLFGRKKGADIDCDASALVCGAGGKLLDKDDIVYFGNLKHRTGAITHLGDNLTGEGEGDDEVILIDFTKVPDEIKKIAITVTIHEAVQRGQNFGQVSNAYVRVARRSNKDDMTGIEELKYDLMEEFSIETAIVVCEIYRHGNDWKFNAVGSGYQGGLEALCRSFGINV